ncbi:Serine hydrolase [Sulfidibacter corallicola]|uniref:Serine hydrolase n=1 Tax=Sulfidibacter corallicola TaxID=2818388 RepID=A0A8A4TTN3_SULCO|nr:serine hydrolase [Sulfidibacter corallicola]QTD52504.1 serine hydrolase [Sulfidibacter corallicola]
MKWLKIGFILVAALGCGLVAQSKPGIAEQIQPVLERQGVSAALKQLDKLRTERPGDFDFGQEQLNRLGHALLSQKRTTDAIAVFEANVQHYPEYATPHYCLGEAYLAADRVADAIDRFQRALRLSPTSGWIWDQMAEAQLRRGDRAATRQWLDIALERHRNQPEAWETASRILSHWQLWPELDALLARQVAAFPRQADPWDRWIVSLVERGEKAAAKAKLSQALDRFDGVRLWRCRQPMAAIGSPVPEADDGWPTGSPAAAGLDPAPITALDRAVDKGDFPHVQNLCVAVDGKLVIEKNYNDGTRYKLHDPRSVGKSFTATLVGLAIDRGRLADTRVPVFPYFTKEMKTRDRKKEEVQLHHLLTMSPGFDAFDDRPSPGSEDTYQQTRDWLGVVVNLDMVYQPGSRFVYSSAASMLAALMVARAIDEPLATFADRTLFAPLAIKSWRWNRTPKGELYGAGNLWLRARDMAKLGQLYLDDGKWQGKRVLSSAWVKAATGKQIDIDTESDYGYYWWRGRYRLGEREVACFYASGNGGNRITVFPELGTVVVITSTAYGRRIGHEHADRIISEHVLPALAKRSKPAR